jgi:hypothetical protein
VSPSPTTKRLFFFLPGVGESATARDDLFFVLPVVVVAQCSSRRLWETTVKAKETSSSIHPHNTFLGSAFCGRRRKRRRKRRRREE